MKDEYKYTGLEVAVIGMAGRFPGAGNWQEYWKNLCFGLESSEKVSDQELIELGVAETTFKLPEYVNVRNRLKNKEQFDSNFFDYRHEEAQLLNPSHRVFHECFWEAIEDAGINLQECKDPIGLFVGSGDDLNWRAFSIAKNQKDNQVDDFSLANINNKDYLATLLSYKFNLKGPAISINTACSTSLVATHMACSSLLFGESKIAIAGGCTILTQKQKGYLFQEGTILSRDGKCRAFDEDATGTIVGEGAGAVVLKRLADAIRDNDQIHAIIKGSAINNDGNRKVGFTAPSVEGQYDCVKKALHFAKVSPETITYVETHGTGTKLGDPIEIEALNLAYKASDKHQCAIGSVKTNIGHLDSAAGVAGLIKSILCLKFKQIPPSLNFQKANSAINFDQGPFYVNTELTKWQSDKPLRCGVSAFGIGGTNAHVILEEAVVSGAGENDTQEPKILTISGKTIQAVERYKADLSSFLNSDFNGSFADLSYTLQVGRNHFNYREAIVFNNKLELISALDRVESRAVKSKPSKVIFMFSGAGSQYSNMGRDLYESQTVFRTHMDEGFLILKSATGIDYSKILFPVNPEDQRINDMLHSQPAIFLFGYSLAKQMLAWGLKPDYMIGHSIGEYIAACIANVFSFEDALRLAVKRGQLMDSLPEGAMISVALNEDQVAAYLNSEISLAAINSPNQVVLSGDVNAIRQVEKVFEQKDVSCIQLYASRAGHSYMMDTIMDEYDSALKQVVMLPPSIPIFCNVTGKLIKNEQATPAYWIKHLRNSVRFAACITNLLALNEALTFVELGGGNSLSNLVQQHYRAGVDKEVVNLIRHPKDRANDVTYLMDRVARLWTRGIRIDWNLYNQGKNRKRISLPTYSFEPVRFDTEVDPFQTGKFSSFEEPLQNTQLKDWIYYPIWKQSPDLNNDAVLEDCLIFSHDSLLFEALRSRIKGNVIELCVGEAFEEISNDKYFVNPAKSESFTELLGVLKRRNISIKTIIYGWSANSNAKEFVFSNEELAVNFFGPINFIKAVLRDGELKDKKFILLTQALHSVLGNERIHYSQSLALGISKVLPQEYSVSCFTIDIAPDDPVSTTADRIIEEIVDDSRKTVVAIRNNRRWLPDFERNRKAMELPTILKRNGAYLITGGLGNVGFILAKYLSSQYEATLILTGRRKIEGASQDELWVQRINELKKTNTNIYYYHVDVTDKDAFDSLTKRIELTTGPINGIIHAAGVIDFDYFELVEDITEKNSISILSPKVKGIMNLYEIFKNRQLDFVWVTSSISSVLGGLTFGAYTSANLFLEHFIASKPELTNWKCIGLGEMAFEEKEILNERAQKRRAMVPEEITRLFEWHIHPAHRSVCFETVDSLLNRIHKAYDSKKDVYLDDSLQSSGIAKVERPMLSSIYIAPESKTEKRITDLFEAFFGIQQVGIEDNFFELGGDSLKAMILLKRINKDFSITIPLKDFFKLQNIREVACEIDERAWIESESKKPFQSVI